MIRERILQRRSLLRRLCCLLFLLPWVNYCQAAFVLQIDSSQVEANAKNQVVSIYLISGPEIQAVNFNLQIEADGTQPAPVIIGLDLIGSGTVFAGNNSGQEILALGAIDDPSVPAGYQFALATTIVMDLDQPVLAQGLLARVTIDTTGILSGIFRFNMSDTLNGPTDFPIGEEVYVPTIVGDWVTIGVIPEPTTSIMFGTGWMVFFCWTRRSR